MGEGYTLKWACWPQHVSFLLGIAAFTVGSWGGWTTPRWLVFTLKWGGIGLAFIAVIAIIYVQFIAAPAPPEAIEATDEAPMTLYWIMLLVGVVAAIAGFVIGRRPGPT